MCVDRTHIVLKLFLFGKLHYNFLFEDPGLEETFQIHLICVNMLWNNHTLQSRRELTLEFPGGAISKYTYSCPRFSFSLHFYHS